MDSNYLWERLPAAIIMNEPSRYSLKGSHRLRVGRWSQGEHTYFITSSIKNKEQLFIDASCCQVVFETIQWIEDQKRWTSYCTMIMPEHVHMVVQIGKGWALEKLMHSFKNYTARQINNLRKRKGIVWQDGYYDHCIRKDESLRDIILYCYHNPVRKGLVKKASDYPYWRCKYRLEQFGPGTPSHSN